MSKAELTEQVLRGEWLGGSDAVAFRERCDRIRERMGRRSGPILVAEEAPIDFLAAFFAALISGRPVVLGNWAWGRHEWRETVKLTGARREGATGAAASDPRRSGCELEPGEILIPTGGTSGRLRFARHSWETLAASAESFGRFFGGAPVKSFCVLPLFHVSGLMQAVRAIVTQGTLRLAEWRRLEAGEAPGPPEDFFLSLVPTQLQRLLNVPELHPWLGRLRAIPLGGAAAPAPLLEEAARLALPLLLSYGATESAAMATAQMPEEFLSGLRTSGRSLPHVTVRIAGPDGSDLAPGEAGRICVSGLSLFHGYSSGEGTEHAISMNPRGAAEEAEWRTGDIGSLDREGRLTVLGREDRVIVTGGEKVSPEEVERALAASGLVEDAVVFGVEDAQWGQAVAAAYVSSKGAGARDLQAALRKELVSFKTPKHWVALPEIPRGANGKIDCQRLEAALATGKLERS